MQEKIDNPFKRNPRSRQNVMEKGFFWLFRLATYFLLACATWLFLDIGIKGGATLFTTDFPFVNVSFLTESPQTLHVFEEKDTSDRITDLKYELETIAAVDGGKASLLKNDIKELRKDLKKTRLSYSDDEFRELIRKPSEEKFYHETYAYSGGGIFPCIVGTFLLVVGAMTIALVLGVLSAIYLSEYSRDGKWIRLIRLSIINLAGVPSIVFGLFGFGMFVLFFDWNVSLMAGWFTLAFMVLPIIITASEEALRAVPQGFREASLALGATKWQAIRTNVLPYALPGILTSSVLGIARVAGETAPIMFTAAYAMRDQLPWQVEKFSDFFFQGVMALPYHIYVVSAKIPQNEFTSRMQYGTAFVFLALVAGISLVSIILRIRSREKYKW